MLKLNIHSAGTTVAGFNLRPGVNRVGRNADNDIVFANPSVSGRHCELLVEGATVVVRDLESANGTFIDGVRVCESILQSGQVFQIGEVEAGLEDEVRIAIPDLSFQHAPAPVSGDGRPLCLNHPSLEATLECTGCGETFCDVCVHQIRRVGGNALVLCPNCSHRCLPIPGLAPPEPELASTFSRWFARVTHGVRGVFLGR